MKFKTHYLFALACILFSFNYLSSQNLILWESECTQCGTLGIQIHTNYDGACGVHFSYTGLIGCPNSTVTWNIRTQFGQVIATYGDSPQGIFHQFTTPGTYVIELRIQMDNGSVGCTESFSTMVTIPPGACEPIECDAACAPPHVGLLQVTPGSNCVVSAIVSEISLYPCNIVNFNYNWGDGSADDVNSKSYFHQYAGNGTYEVCVTITSTNGTDICETRLCRTVEVTNCSPNKRGETVAPDPAVVAYPNPIEAGKTLFIEPQGFSGPINATLFDLNGRIVAEWDGVEAGIPIPENLSPGTYFLRSGALKASVVKVIVK